MTHNELLYVKTIAEETSISAAARKLFVAQPALSQAVQRLENNLGVKLFQRTSTGMKLTYAGERYYRMANQILRMYDEFQIEVSDINHLQSGRLAFGTTFHFGSQILPQILPAYRKHYPNIQVQIFEGTAMELEQMLTSGQIDFAIQHNRSSENKGSIRYDSFAWNPFIVTVSADFPYADLAKPSPELPFLVLPITALAELPFLAVSKGKNIRRITDHIFEKAGICPRIGLELQNFSTLQRLAAQGLGFTLVPEDYLNDFQAQTYHPRYFCLDPALEAGWCSCICTYKDAFLSKADEAMIHLVRNYYASLKQSRSAN